MVLSLFLIFFVAFRWFGGFIRRIGGSAIFGSGRNGSFDLDGTNTYAAFFSKSGNIYTQIADIDGGIDITGRSGCTWRTGRWRARGYGTALLKSGFLYDCSGTNASSNAGAVAPAAAALFSGTDGGAGGTGAGSAGVSNTQALGGSGGEGGAGNDGASAGGGGGAATNSAAGTVGLDALGWPAIWQGIVNKLAAWAGLVGGCGGGGGGGDGTAGPGGGSGAPPSVLAWRSIVVESGAEVRNSGGLGLSASAGKRGGGAGGGGNWSSWTYDSIQFDGALDFGGGDGGVGFGGPLNKAGNNGLAGRFDFVPNVRN